MSQPSLQAALKKYFGFDAFRPMQEEIISHILTGGHALVIMPTGGGKSVCYQLPAILMEGITVVISPLISLMNDQVRALKANGIPAGALHSGTDAKERKAIVHDIEEGKLKLLYVSPEKALSRNFIEFIRSKGVSLMAIDEAHCVSIWGNDFRPEYANLSELIRFFPDTSIIALTATADVATQQDICQQLQLKDPKVYLSSFERPNIYLSVQAGIQRLDHIKTFIRRQDHRPGIVYCLARKTTESIAKALRKAGYKAEPYHAELDNVFRRKVQEDFQHDRIQIVCATVAFGMGIDKPNIGWIVHYNLPKNIESYYQEVGRAGRDGQPAEALMFYSFRDVSVYREFIENSQAVEDFKRVQSEKLDRIWEYSQATNCRTNVILNYFGEYRSEPCGHCDLCLHPREGFDGTQLAQMALSACKRCGESLGIGLLVDVLRGSGRKEIYDRSLQLVKTYGAGRNVSWKDWMHYITQLINQGLLNIDYVNHSVLKCTPLSDEVLFHNKAVTLHRQVSLPAEPIQKKVSKRDVFNKELINRLVALCKTYGREENIPPHSIFSKEVIREMAEVRPITMRDFSKVNGVGEHKAEKYGQGFVDLIRAYMADQNVLKNPKGMTYIETLDLFHQGLSLEEIAGKRQMAESTIAAHLGQLYEKGEDINLTQFLLPDDLVIARQGWRASGFSEQIKKVKEQVGDSISYPRLHIALAVVKKKAANES